MMNPKQNFKKQQLFQIPSIAFAGRLIFGLIESQDMSKRTKQMLIVFTPDTHPYSVVARVVRPANSATALKNKQRYLLVNQNETRPSTAEAMCRLNHSDTAVPSLGVSSRLVSLGTSSVKPERNASGASFTYFTTDQIRLFRKTMI
jgi:hypothetical protein